MAVAKATSASAANEALCRTLSSDLSHARPTSSFASSLERPRRTALLATTSNITTVPSPSSRTGLTASTSSEEVRVLR
eukprot:5356652-Pyramimonas_sp.AAC.1